MSKVENIKSGGKTASRNSTFAHYLHTFFSEAHHGTKFTMRYFKELARYFSGVG